ncbi:MAG: DUF1653 domain-containing protein [Acetatifactor sp.]|nr:DUF1653 domain-containing protein [Acetatifactor sp.]
MTFIPKPHEIYKHFKGNLYQIVAIAEHTETKEQLVIYQAMYGDFRIFARPLEMFLSEVDREKYPDVEQKYRFELQNSDRKRESQETATEYQTKTENFSEQAESPAGPQLDPLVIEFLDADTYEQRLNILAGLQHRITDEMITTMAIACDVEVEDGDTQSRFNSLKQCLLTLEKYECNRLR